MIHYILESAKYILLSRKINKNKLDTFPSFNSARNTEQTDFTSSIKKINAELHLRTSDTNFSIFHFRRFPSSNTMNYSHACPRKENFSLPLTQTYTSLSLSFDISKEKCHVKSSTAESREKVARLTPIKLVGPRLNPVHGANKSQWHVIKASPLSQSDATWCRAV